MEHPEASTKERWKKEQNALKQKLITTDQIDWKTPGKLKLIGGVDISFVKDDQHPDGPRACAGLVMFDVMTRKIVYEDMEVVHLTQPYIAGFLAFREVEFLVRLVEKAKKKGKVPDIIMVDGNGTLHPRGFGLACHLGVLTDIPCIGVAKNFLVVDCMDMDETKARFQRECRKSGDYMMLKGKSGRTWGTALKPNDEVIDPIFVSAGHKLSLQSSVIITLAMCDYRVPEPVRQADIRTRAYLRENIKE
jgi:deoxyinosine 3'endonuclease (endonuclease V)